MHKAQSPRRSWPRPNRRLAKVLAAVWLPVLLGCLAIVLEPVVDDFLLGVFLLMLAHVTTWLPDLVRTVRRPSHGP